MGGLHDHRYAIEQDDFMAPVELIGFSRRKTQRDVSRSRGLHSPLLHRQALTAHGVVTTVIAAPAGLLEDPDQRQLLASGLGRIPCQQPVEFCCPSVPASVAAGQHARTRMRSRPTSAPSGTVFRDTFRSRAISLIVLPLIQVLAPYPGNCLHDQHPRPPASITKQAAQHEPTCRGSFLDADPPA